LLLFKRSQTDTLFSWERDPWVLALADHENVADSGGERVASSISDVDDIETTDVSVSVDYNSDSSNVVTRSDHAQVAGFELSGLNDLAGSDVELDGVVDVDFWVGESEGSTIVGNNVRNLVGADSLLGDLAELVFSFLSADVSEDESALYVVENSVKLTSLLDADNIHKTSWESRVSSDLAVNSDVSFLVIDNHSDFSSSKSVFKTVLENDCKWKTFSVFVGTLGGFCCEDAAQFVEHPALGSVDSL